MGPKQVQARKPGRPAAIETRFELRQTYRFSLLSGECELPRLLYDEYGIGSGPVPLSDKTIKKHLQKHLGDVVEALRPKNEFLGVEVGEIALRVLKDNVNNDYIDEKLRIAAYECERWLYTGSETTYIQRDQTTRNRSIKNASRSIARRTEASWGRSYPRRRHLNHQVRFVPEVVGTWTSWIINRLEKGSAMGFEEMLSNLQKDIEMEANIIGLDYYGDSLLHAFISYIDACTMEASQVQKILQVILRRPGDLMTQRNAVGETPLHLAVRRALPHVVVLLLLRICWTSEEYDRYSHLHESRRPLPDPEKLRSAIQVPNYRGVTLLTDLHLAYWLWRNSEEEGAMHSEIDAFLCIYIVVNALLGRLIPGEKKFRSLRSLKNLPQGDEEVEDRRYRRQREQEFRAAIGHLPPPASTRTWRHIRSKSEGDQAMAPLADDTTHQLTNQPTDPLAEYMWTQY